MVGAQFLSVTSRARSAPGYARVQLEQIYLARRVTEYPTSFELATTEADRLALPRRIGAARQRACTRSELARLPC